MKIVQTFWSGGKNNLMNESYGWFSPDYHVMGWVLSSNLLRRYYSDVELYTDKVGYELFIKKLNLPYTKVHVVLDCLNKYNSKLWALPKIYTYSLQEEPFLHIDGDVFIWGKFDKDLMSSEFITQNMESATEYYKKLWIELENNLSYFPEEIIQDRKENTDIKAYNVGIFGGNNIQFIKQYTKKAFEFVDKNISSLQNINVGNFNIFFEQYMFYCLTKNKKVDCFFDEIFEDNGYKGFGNFEQVPKEKKYLHLLGTYKRNAKTCIKMTKQLLVEFPLEYIKTLKQFNCNSIGIYDTCINLNNTDKFKSFHEYYNPIPQIEKYPRTVQILKKHLNYSLKEIIEIFENNKKIRSEIDFHDNEEFISVYKYEKNNENYLNSLKHNNVYDLCLANYKNSKLYLDFINSPFSYSFKRAHSIKEIKTSFLIGDDVTFYIGENISKNFTRLIVPSLEKPYYQEIIMDELDEIIFEETSTAVNLKQLLKNLEKYFDLEDLENSKKEYQKLIINKIRMLVYNNAFYLNKDLE